ncbi:hypothetical protein B0I37DRAFT_360379 [Chaetomium sp. MPI-CAGE-AT-0009]|nr:hypothetical protein B0I37DRAFT_360379 [Chaetomium sp. MPI-CAGE-AT-0009]
MRSCIGFFCLFLLYYHVSVGDAWHASDCTTLMMGFGWVGKDGWTESGAFSKGGGVRGRRLGSRCDINKHV